MFICESCNKCSKPGISCKRVVTRKQRYLHPERAKAVPGVLIQRNGKEKQAWFPDPGGWGTQIVRETKMCPPCAIKYEKQQQEDTVSSK